MCVCHKRGGVSLFCFLSAVVDYPITESAMRLQNIKTEVEEKTVAMRMQKKRKVDRIRSLLLFAKGTRATFPFSLFLWCLYANDGLFLIFRLGHAFFLSTVFCPQVTP